MPGTLADIDPDNDNGFLAFIHLVGTMYFKRYNTGFKTTSPEAYYRTFVSSHSIKEQHFAWLNGIRQTIWHRIKHEDEMIPSNDSLYLHWKRTCWVANMWR